MSARHIQTPEKHAPHLRSLKDLARSFRSLSEARLQSCLLRSDSAVKLAQGNAFKIEATSLYSALLYLQRPPQNIKRHLIRHFGSKFLFERTLGVL